MSEDDRGVYDAMNKGILESKGEWLYFLGDDDQLYTENTLDAIFSQPVENHAKMIIGSIQYNLKKGDKVYANKGNGIVVSSWSKKLWIKNSIHHQGVFYKRELFSNLKYDLKYNILADHALNLILFKKGIGVKIIDDIIALCGTNGQSKNYSWDLYKEEITLKIGESSLLLKPVFMIIGFSKFLLKKIKFK